MLVHGDLGDEAVKLVLRAVWMRQPSQPNLPGCGQWPGHELAHLHAIEADGDSVSLPVQGEVSPFGVRLERDTFSKVVVRQRRGRQRVRDNRAPDANFDGRSCERSIRRQADAVAPAFIGQEYAA